MADQFCVLILALPLFAAILVSLLGYWSERYCLPVTILAMAGALFAAVKTLLLVEARGELHYFLGGWSQPHGIGIEFRVDTINGLVLVLIAAVGLITAFYSREPVERETPDKVPQFYTLYLLVLTGLMGMTITGDAFNLYVLLEVSSLSGYALIAMGPGKRAALAAFNYVIMGTIGASFYLLGVGYLYLKTGSLNMADIRQIILDRNLYGSETINVALILIMLGVWIKMAFFPLHAWLPNAYTYCPSTTSGLIAPLMTKVSIYVMIRMILTVFGSEYVFAHLKWSRLVVWLAMVVILAGSVMALSQTHLKKLLAYLIVAEVGYMVGGFWLANEYGMLGAIYHILSDAVMTSCLFLTAGIFVSKTGSDAISGLENGFRKMPLTMAAFTLGAFSMIGIPPTCGFFSKWYLIRGGLEAGQYGFVVALLISSLVNAILFFRILEIAFFPKFPERTETNHHAHEEHGHSVRIQEASAWMLGPLLIASVGLLLIGIFNSDLVEMIRATLAQYGIVGGGF